MGKVIEINGPLVTIELADVRTGEAGQRRQSEFERGGHQLAMARAPWCRCTNQPNRCAPANRSRRSDIHCQWSWGQDCWATSSTAFNVLCSNTPSSEATSFLAECTFRRSTVVVCGASSRRPISPSAPDPIRRLLGSVQETLAILHRILAPPGVDGRIAGHNFRKRHHGRRRRGSRRIRAGRCPRTQAVSPLAGAHPASLPPPRRSRGAAAHRAANPRHLLPAGEGRARRHTRSVRRRQDHGAATDRPVVRRRHRDLRRLRRARQRTGGHPGKLPQTHRSATADDR